MTFNVLVTIFNSVRRHKGEMKDMRTLTTALLTLALAASVFADDHGPKKADIVDTAVAAGSFKTLAAALQAADLVTTIALQRFRPFLRYECGTEASK